MAPRCVCNRVNEREKDEREREERQRERDSGVKEKNGEFEWVIDREYSDRDRSEKEKKWQIEAIRRARVV